jgi:phosphatidylethanolamine-binding protein (PEBP) family uncharacterized protein
MACSQGPGSKTYTVSIYALSDKLTLTPSSATQSALISAMDGKIIDQAKIDFTYTRGA